MRAVTAGGSTDSKMRNTKLRDLNDVNLSEGTFKSSSESVVAEMSHNLNKEN